MTDVLVYLAFCLAQEAKSRHCGTGACESPNYVYVHCSVVVHMSPYSSPIFCNKQTPKSLFYCACLTDWMCTNLQQSDIDDKMTQINK